MGIMFRFKITLCQAEAGAHCSYLLWAIYMAVSTGTWRFDRSSYDPEGLYRDALGTNCIDSSRGRAFGTNCGRMAMFFPSRVACKKTRENISELRFLTQ